MGAASPESLRNYTATYIPQSNPAFTRTEPSQAVPRNVLQPQWPAQTPGPSLVLKLHYWRPQTGGHNTSTHTPIRFPTCPFHTATKPHLQHRVRHCWSSTHARPELFRHTWWKAYCCESYEHGCAVSAGQIAVQSFHTIRAWHVHTFGLLQGTAARRLLHRPFVQTPQSDAKHRYIDCRTICSTR